MRIVRQLVLQRGGHRFHILIGEAALHRTVGDGAVMAAQLEHLRGELDRPNVRLGVITRMPRTAALRRTSSCATATRCSPRSPSPN